MGDSEHESVSKDTAVPKKRQTDEISHRMLRLSTKCNKLGTDPKQNSVRPKKKQCSEIAELSSQLHKKLNPTNFTQEVHLKPSDPGYGTPQVGTETAARGKKAHENISNEIVEMAEMIWEHGQMTGEEKPCQDIIHLSNMQVTLMVTSPVFSSRTCSVSTTRYLEM